MWSSTWYYYILLNIQPFLHHYIFTHYLSRWELEQLGDLNYVWSLFPFITHLPFVLWKFYAILSITSSSRFRRWFDSCIIMLKSLHIAWVFIIIVHIIYLTIQVTSYWKLIYSWYISINHAYFDIIEYKSILLEILIIWSIFDHRTRRIHITMVWTIEKKSLECYAYLCSCDPIKVLV